MLNSTQYIAGYAKGVDDANNDRPIPEGLPSEWIYTQPYRDGYLKGYDHTYAYRKGLAWWLAHEHTINQSDDILH